MGGDHAVYVVLNSSVIVCESSNGEKKREKERESKRICKSCCIYMRNSTSDAFHALLNCDFLVFFVEKLGLQLVTLGAGALCTSSSDSDASEEEFTLECLCFFEAF
jgi:hypothetical protein